MTKISFAKKIITISIVLGLVVLVLIFFVIIPIFKDIKEAAYNIIEAKKDLVFFEKEVKRAEAFEENYNNLEITPEKIDKFLIDSSVPIEFIDFLENLAKKQNLSIKISPAFSIESSETSFNSMVFKIETSGNFSEIMKFLGKMESSPYFVLIDKFYIREGAGRSNIVGQENTMIFGQVFSTIEIKVYAK
jgi:hypothetical protein